MNQAQGSETNARILALLATPNSARGPAWEHELEYYLVRATFGNQCSISGRFGDRRYACCPLAGAEPEAPSFQDMVRFATDKGCGLTIEVNGRPALHLSFGQLATYRMFNSMRTPPGWNGGPAPQGLGIPSEQDAWTAPPNEEYLPLFVRAPIRAYFREHRSPRASRAPGALALASEPPRSHIQRATLGAHSRSFPSRNEIFDLVPP